MQNKWFIIINPTSGNGAAKKKWFPIYRELQLQQFNFDFVFTEYTKHSILLVKNAIKNGYEKFICIGGDGTLHNIINGILRIKPLNISKFKIGIIPVGTGNDWVKTYKIPKNYKEAITIIKKENMVLQDIGKISLEKGSKEFFFTNLAGIGFDGYVVNKVNKYKKLGFLAYITGALVSITSFKKPTLEFFLNNLILKEKTLMLLIGICNYSGGGMQLTKNPNSTDGLFDISYIQKITLFTILGNIRGLYNGKITNHKLVKTYKTTAIKINVLDTSKTYIQADGELIGTGSFSVSILPKSLHFIVP